MVSLKLRDEALLMLEGRGQVLETARQVSAAMVHADVRAAIIGGVAIEWVFLSQEGPLVCPHGGAGPSGHVRPGA